MNYSAKSSNPINVASGCLVTAVFSDKSLSDTARAVDAKMNGALSAALRRGDLKGKIGDAVLFQPAVGLKARRVLAVCCGEPRKELSASATRKLAGAVAKELKRHNVRHAAIAFEGVRVAGRDAADGAALLVEGLESGLYAFDRLKREKAERTLQSVTLHGSSRAAARALGTGVERGVAVANGVRLARDLGNLPGNVCTPSYLAREALKLRKSHGLKVTVLDEARMGKLGMGSLLSVSRGSREPAKLIVMEYAGSDRKDAPLALVGKGLTFDAGGISLKPAAAMDEMKYDMCGGASVFGTLVAAAEQNLPVNLVGIVPSSENLPDGAANKPGDIVTSMAGKTIEILNTDAEGRLILCDALTYARRYKPQAVIDVATLTGACVIALGAPASGLFTKNDALADALLAAGEESGDRAWRMPVWDDYQEQLDSPFADVANVGGRSAGAVTAACFLARFTEELNWAHLDIAGTAWTTGANKGATGRPVSLLTRYVANHARG